MKILIAPDSFKESLEALDVCHAIQSGFSQVFPDADYKLLPMADGGEGTSAVLSYVLGGRWKEVRVHDPLMRPITAKYLLLPDATAVIEVAQACGLHLLTADERNPVIASSYGVGELIADALEEGAKRIIIGLGGSATNDAGLGMLMALGITFHDINDSLLTHGGGALASLHKLDNTSLHAKISDTIFEVACDVTNPLCGLLGASAVFGPQKGACPEQVNILDEALSHFATICGQHGYEDCQHVAGAGAAGGLGYAMMTFFKAQLKSGFDTVAEVAHLSQHIAEADLVITGEGKLDAQTAMGKVAGGISQIAKASRTPVIAICGSVDGLKPAQTSQFDVVMPSIQKVDTIDNVLGSAYNNIETTAANIAASIKLGQTLK
ncbi:MULTISPECIES: glycerate kinase [Psychrobacter]|uniref:glycerate kinase n=1 Tax=Psychrobacter TaxID=497 RepID=UPI0008687081|nr:MULTISPECIES: glycerate kinase [Psychrobacter]MBA6245372.1 glycerate kinase [Psychrobacter sp. Urea-trap-18]MBA6286886.1 glycerate kinase [Psychrobacter sp. Urea-trap-16]MBA6317932.1 glycerate kinase [Psychrobacter sp. Urea-trap-20]MBA6335177.1 glycerate kinase [Psychrobacter sp. Urea-trap-19]OEH69077.1 MAG: glycerate kinase [Psychrobacter sp. B29-1]|tara:strand:- start:51519 stop:52655 length:1137 start_codon:yes stop_codon:yes gene_type:complete